MSRRVYGFIVPDNGAADVLLHVTVLRKDGFQTAREGARVVCEAIVRSKGLQVFRVLSMDELDGGASDPIADGAAPMFRSRRRAASKSSS